MLTPHFHGLIGPPEMISDDEKDRFGNISNKFAFYLLNLIFQHEIREIRKVFVTTKELHQ